MTTNGSSADPLLTADFTKPAFRRGKHCKCQKCSSVFVCTPNTDAFVRSCDVKLEDTFGPLYCLKCIKSLYEQEVNASHQAKNNV